MHSFDLLFCISPSLMSAYCKRMQVSLLCLGPFHTYPFSFENKPFSLRIGLLSTRIRWKRWQKTQVFENALQTGNFWILRFRVFVWTVKTELFENDDVTVLNSAHSTRIKSRAEINLNAKWRRILWYIKTQNIGVLCLAWFMTGSSTSSTVQTNESALLLQLPLDLPSICPDVFKLFPCNFSSS